MKCGAKRNFLYTVLATLKIKIMTAKEKANELANKFISKSVFNMTNEELKEQREQGKAFAIICVDEILGTIKRDSDFTTTYERSKRYWTDVRTEISLL